MLMASIPPGEGFSNCHFLGNSIQQIFQVLAKGDR